jgi:hypothetical protein
MGTTDHPLRSELIDSLDTFNSGAVADAVKHFAPDVAFTVPGHSAVAGTYRGREGVTSFFGKLHELSDGSFSVVPEEVLANDDHMVLFLHFNGTRGESNLDVTMAGFHSDHGPEGWRRATFLVDDLGAFDRFFAAQA